LGSAIEESLDRLADHRAGAPGSPRLRVGVAAAAAMFGAWLAVGNGVALP
jgi:hypothetical protein